MLYLSSVKESNQAPSRLVLALAAELVAVLEEVSGSEQWSLASLSVRPRLMVRGLPQK